MRARKGVCVKRCIELSLLLSNDDQFKPRRRQRVADLDGMIGYLVINYGAISLCVRRIIPHHFREDACSKCLLRNATARRVDSAVSGMGRGSPT